MSIPSNTTSHVVVQRSSEDGQWFAKPGKTADGDKAVIFFQRAGKQSALQSLKDVFTGVRNGKQAAKEYLQSFGHKQNPGVSLNQHIKHLETKGGRSGTITKHRDSKNAEGGVEFRMTEKIAFQTTPTMMKQKLKEAVYTANSSILNGFTKTHISGQIDLAVEVSTNKNFISIIKPDPDMLLNAAYNLNAYAGQLQKDQPELAITLRKMMVDLQTAASQIQRSVGQKE